MKSTLLVALISSLLLTVVSGCSRREEPVPSPVPQEVVQPAQTNVATRIHVVEEGEDIYAVAMMWGVSAQSIKQLNGLADSTVKPGQRLRIPMTE